MSCFIQKKENTAAIADFISALYNMGHDYFGMYPPDSIHTETRDLRDRYGYLKEDALYIRLRYLNYLAYEGRYKHATEESINSANFEDFEPYEANIVYKRAEWLGGIYKVEKWHYKMLKMIQCYLYQCDESATKDEPMIKAVREVVNVLKTFIVMNQPEYDEIDWA